jgi:(1->4)-alpha-D-glucan 1-alpha-D-glucosylmutase
MRRASAGNPMMQRPPLTATYRLQMNASFTLAQACERVDYFARLGVSHLYLSPILAARTGSMHGYDVTDPTRINPEIGDESNLRELARALHARGMGLIVDIVPNHMGIGPENRHWDDVLTHGDRSRYARWFDIDWTARDGHRKLILPVLGDDLDAVIGRRELTVKLVEGETPRITYFDQTFPVDPASLPGDLQLAQVDPEEAGELTDAYSGESGRDRLRALIDAQHYRLVHWRRGPAEINYRRFFDVNELAALRVEDETVFHETHAYILSLASDGTVDGLRVDHIDGLLEPDQYLARLRAATSPDTPIFVEKILSPGETLRPSWPVSGTTGYEFLNDLGDAFIDAQGFAEIEKHYRHMRRLEDNQFHDIARAGKVAILNGALRADVTRLTALFAPIARGAHKRWSEADMTTALVDFMAALPVYRTYLDAAGALDDAGRRVVAAAVADAVTVSSVTDTVSFIGGVIAGDVQVADTAARLAFVQRLQQVSGPATAKGVEDTALYSYVPLASRDEVGGSPDRSLENAVARLHDANQHRATHWPLSIVSTNTHDTKRSADIRSRLEALSEIPDEWDRCVRRWRRLNDKHREIVGGRMAPDTNSEYLLYQTLVALWPPARADHRVDDVPDRAWLESARERLTRYMLKAGREAKLRTTWTDPDTAYEQAVERFVAAILTTADDAPFLSDVARLVALVAAAGACNALARVAVHLTAPGTPDVYQGDELWNYTLVDPDNRQPVDYAARAAALGELDVVEQALHDSGPVNLHDNRVKLLVTQRLLCARRAHADVFTRGSYEPLRAEGARANHVIAFARSFGGRTAIAIASRLASALDHADPVQWWGDTAIALPAGVDAPLWHSQILSSTVTARAGRIALSEALAKLPVAMLLR